MNRRQLHMIEYLREENVVLREQLGARLLRLNDDQRRRLAAEPRGLGRKLLAEVPVRSLEASCLERPTLFGESSLWTGFQNVMARYHTERNV